MPTLSCLSNLNSATFCLPAGGHFKTPVVCRGLRCLQVFEIIRHKPHKLSHAKQLLLHLQYSLLIQKNEQALAPASQHVDHSAQFLMINQRCFFAYWITPWVNHSISLQKASSRTDPSLRICEKHLFRWEIRLLFCTAPDVVLHPAGTRGFRNSECCGPTP